MKCALLPLVLIFAGGCALLPVRDDSIFSEYNREDRRFMEYVAYHDTYADVPVDLIIAEWEKEYGAERVRQWISLHEAAKDGPVRDFASEEVVKG